MFKAYCYLLTYLTTCSSVSIVNFKHVIAGWDSLKVSSWFKFYGYMTFPFKGLPNNVPIGI